jgi:hypothetical protein
MLAVGFSYDQQLWGVLTFWPLIGGTRVKTNKKPLEKGNFN